MVDKILGSFENLFMQQVFIKYLLYAKSFLDFGDLAVNKSSCLTICQKISDIYNISGFPTPRHYFFHHKSDSENTTEWLNLSTPHLRDGLVGPSSVMTKIMRLLQSSRT